MNATPDFSGGVWLVDFEFRPASGREGNPPVPVCMVAIELRSGRTLRLWLDTQQTPTSCPFPTNGSSLVVAYYASAEMGCFRALGWPTPVNVLDLYSEFRNHTNGKEIPCGKGLLGALTYFGLPSILVDEKDAMRTLILGGSPWSAAERQRILDYCATDAEALRALFPAMAPYIDWPRALLRGQYTVAVAAMERRGIPIDMELYARLKDGWDHIKDQLVAEVDTQYGVYEGGSFRRERFRHYLHCHAISWPHLPSGGLDLSDQTFRDMATVYPQLQPLRQLRQSLAKFRPADWHIGDDGRSRCLLSMFSSKTGRNQPSNAKFVFGAPAWQRWLMQPKPGWGLAYIDWSQQELGIAAALSGDAKMMEAYTSGDSYLAFAKQAGAVPAEATKRSHQHERDLFKQCVLAVQYGMGAEGLALRIRQPVAAARRLLDLHRQTYRRFWEWSDSVLDEARLGGRLWTTFGWQLHVTSKTNGRTLRNFPMQANGAEMLRIACIELVREGIGLCAPVHDAVLIEAPLDELDAAIDKAQEIMRRASVIVLNGFTLRSDVQVIRYPDHFEDHRGTALWERVMPLLDRLEQQTSGHGDEDTTILKEAEDAAC